MAKLKMIFGFEKNSPTRYFIGNKEITKIMFAKECMKRSQVFRGSNSC